MATKSKSAKRGISDDELKGLQATIGRNILREIRALDPKAVAELTITSPAAQSGHFSDWHDRFRDNGGFSDGFGKAGNIKVRVAGLAASKGTRGKR